VRVDYGLAILAKAVQFLLELTALVSENVTLMPERLKFSIGSAEFLSLFGGSLEV
jgi:hypothetical protein